MFDISYEIKSMQDAIERIQDVSDSGAFKRMVCDLRAYMKNLGMDVQSIIELEKRAYYLPNEYSEKDNRERMEDAKNRIIEYLTEILNNCTDEKLLIQVLENYYLFLENLFERETHKRGGKLYFTHFNNTDYLGRRNGAGCSFFHKLLSVLAFCVSNLPADSECFCGAVAKNTFENAPCFG